MGTSGNRSGYKVFSINTTIRNPQRNIDFIRCLKNFNGLTFNNEIKKLYLIELVKNGVYKFNNIPGHIKDKLLNDVILNDNEVSLLLDSNPQKTGFSGRVMTQLRSLKEQGLLIFIDESRTPKIIITSLGFALIDGVESFTDIYSKIMIGLHAYNPSRTSILNRSRVFLNTLFVINLLKQEWLKSGNKEAKGILKHEFKSFVLGMKDCNYKKCVDEILKYRKLFGLKENKEYIQDYLFKKQGLMRLKYTTLNDYADDVFRKFLMTGLLIARGKSSNIYYDFSSFNIKKVESILHTYKNYKFETFKDADSYVIFLDNIKLPWKNDMEVKKDVIKQKAKLLDLEDSKLDFSNLDVLEEKLNQRFYSQAIDNILQNNKLEAIIKELRILNGDINEKSQYDLPEPLRLEYILALAFAKKYGNDNLISNLIYNEDGMPLSYAPAGKVDLEYKNFLIEATMIKNRNQQLNSETTSIARHMKEKQDKTNTILRTMLIAPYIHWDVALFFKFCAKEFESKIAPISIQNFISLLEKSDTFEDFKNNFDYFVKCLKTDNINDYLNLIN